MDALDGPLKGKVYRDVPEHTQTLVDQYRTDMDFYQVTYERTKKGWKFKKEEKLFQERVPMSSYNYLTKSVDHLTDIYINAVKEYIRNRLLYETMHMEDFAAEMANFSECFFATVQALTKD